VQPNYWPPLHALQKNTGNRGGRQPSGQDSSHQRNFGLESIGAVRLLNLPSFLLLLRVPPCPRAPAPARPDAVSSSASRGYGYLYIHQLASLDDVHTSDLTPYACACLHSAYPESKATGRKHFPKAPSIPNWKRRIVRRTHPRVVKLVKLVHHGSFVERLGCRR
jgi:hypothetical protein